MDRLSLIGHDGGRRTFRAAAPLSAPERLLPFGPSISECAVATDTLSNLIYTGPLAWTPDGRAVFVWLEHTAIVTKTVRDVYLKNMGIPYTFEIPMEQIDPPI